MADLKISQLTNATTPLAGTEVVPIVQSSSTKKVAVSDLTAGRAVSVASLTATGNVNFSGTSNRITGDFSNGTIVNRVLFQTSTANGSTSVDLIPNGSSVVSSFRMYNSSSDPDNASFGQFVITSAEVRTASNRAGTGTYLPYTIYTNGSEQFRVTTAGNIEARTGNFVPFVAGKGVNFTANTPAAGMTSQLLNWYEEGTFTVTVTSGSGAITSYTTQGTYVRIGTSVNVRLAIKITSPGTAGGQLTFTGLPFSSYNYSDGYKASTFLVREDNNSGVAYQGFINNNSTVGVIASTNNGNVSWTTDDTYVFQATYRVA